MGFFLLFVAIIKDLKNNNFNKYRKSVRYKHRFSSVPPDDNDTEMSSQETLKQDDLCALKSDLQKENINDVELEELELTGEYLLLNQKSYL